MRLTQQTNYAVRALMYCAVNPDKPSKVADIAASFDMSETHLFKIMKVLVDADSKLVLGAAILGVGGDEVVHSLLQLMAADTPYTTMMETVHIHPTVSELLPTLLADLKPLD